MMTIWQFQDRISRRLLRWSLFSMVAGLLMRFGGTFWRGMGAQFFTWGAIDAGIALFGRIGLQNQVDQHENPGLPEIRQDQSRNLGRILWINAGLDILYMIFGWWLVRRDEGQGQRSGHGWGIIWQGLFLFVFDVIHARRRPDREA